MATVNDEVHALPAGGIHWARVFVAAFLLEVALVAVLAPVGIVFGQHALFLTAVPIACLLFSYLAGRLVARGLPSRVAHGMLTGVIGTALYLVLCTLNTGGLSGTIAVYGPILFWGSNALSIIGTTAGAAHAINSRSAA